MPNTKKKSSKRALGGTAYERQKSNIRASQQAAVREASELANGNWIHPPTDQARKDFCENDLRRFLETYLPERFPLAWSDDHLRVIDCLQRVILTGEMFAELMPRGSGKTTLAEGAIIWAILYGHRRYPVIIGADANAAESVLKSIMEEFEDNDRLEEDFSEVVGPIRALEGKPQRCKSQTFNGERTRISWTAKSIVMPRIPGSKAASSIFAVAGITGRIRGLKRRGENGEIIRPDFALLDDIQTDESAESYDQTRKRIGIVKGAVLGLAGPGKRIALLALLTMIANGDVADQFLDHKKFPEMQGVRMKMVYAFPTNEKLWDEYGEIYREEISNGRGYIKATNFYVAHRVEMDAGARVAWPARFDAEHSEVSAIQSAMNLKITMGDHAFFAECQNEPIKTALSIEVKKEQIEKKTNGLERGQCLPTTEKVTSFIDVGGKLLWWMFCGWDVKSGGHIIDYGAWPEQGSSYFTKSSPRISLVQHYRQGDDGSVYAGLIELINWMNERTFRRTDGLEMPSSHLMVDTGWNTQLVRKALLNFRGKPVHPSKGRGLKAGQAQISDFKVRPGERMGENWIQSTPGADGLRLIQFDSNRWKSKCARALAAPAGEIATITLNGSRNEQLASHLASEKPTMTTANGIEIEIWNPIVGQDNDWLDCFVGCAVGANMTGISATPTTPIKKKQRLSSEEYLKKHYGNVRT